MSGIVNKIKEAVHGDKHNTASAPEGTHGPHSGRVANAADPRVDSDRDHSNTLGGNRTAGTSGLGSSTHTTGTHTTGTHTGTHTAGTGFGSTGTSGLGSGTHTTGTHTSGLGSTGTHTAGTGYGSSGTAEGVHGPHSSRVANAADPRVDSDRDGRAAAGHSSGLGGLGGAGTHTGHTGTHAGGLGNTGAHTGTHTSGIAGTHTAGTGYGSSGTAEGVHGPHSSRVANAADPRVDSDRDHSRTVGGGAGRTAGHGEYGASHGTMGTSGLGSTGAHTGTHTGTHAGGLGSTGTHTGAHTGTHAGSGATGMTGTHGAPAGTYGTHNSRAANLADPRIDSDRDGRGALGHSGPGPAPNTAGPHKSDMVNKVDPRVDSDLDGSKTVGGNKTYQSGSTYNKDPTDAAQVPPSVLQQHVPGPVPEHADALHHRERRNSTKTHQESFSGI